MGACLGLYHALAAQGKSVQLVAPTEVPRHYRWLPGAEQFRQSLEDAPEVALVLDCDGLERLGDLRKAIESVPTVVDIDHHAGENPFGDVQYLQAGAAATTQLVFRLLQQLQWPITPEIATCLYTGLATDTGFFHFENTSAEALADAAELVRLGAMPAQIAEAVGDTYSLPRTKLRGRALASAQMDASGRIASGVLWPADYRETGTAAGDTEGVIDDLKQIEGQQVAVLFKAPEREDQWQVSMRSARVNVAAVARRFGGGGHARAAGCDVNGPLAEVTARVLAALTEALDQFGET
jgi:phosphoesterase RecJ-like protein